MTLNTIKTIFLSFSLFLITSFAKSEVIKLECNLKVEENDLITKQVKTFNETSIYSATTYENLSVPFLIGNFKETECKKEDDGEVLCKKEILKPYNYSNPIGNKLKIITRLNRNTGKLTWWTSEHTWRASGDIRYVMTNREGLCKKFVQKKIF